MRSKYARLVYIVFLLFVSSFGLIVSMIMLEHPVRPTIEFAGRRILVGFIYGLVCLGGMFAVFLPGPCSRLVGVRRSGEQYLRGLDARATSIFAILLLHGHHPLGQESSTTHELRFRGKSFCASCFGLLTGAIMSLMAIVVFLFSDWAGGYLAHFLYFLGLGGVALGLVPALLGVGARTRFVLGMIFVSGTCVMLIAMDVATANLIADLLVVLLVLFWLISRISLSHRN
jgi:hypothetical protein